MKNFSVKTTGAGISGCPPRMLSDIGPMICSNLGERVADHAALAVASDDQRISFRGPQRIHHRIRRIFFDIGFGTFAFRIDEIFLRMGIAAAGIDAFYQNFILLHTRHSLRKSSKGIDFGPLQILRPFWFRMAVLHWYFSTAGRKMSMAKGGNVIECRNVGRVF